MKILRLVSQRAIHDRHFPVFTVVYLPEAGNRREAAVSTQGCRSLLFGGLGIEVYYIASAGLFAESAT